MDTNDAKKPDRRDFLQVAGATVALGSLSFASPRRGSATDPLKIGNVGLMSPGDMGQALAIQIKARGLKV